MSSRPFRLEFLVLPAMHYRWRWPEGRLEAPELATSVVASGTSPEAASGPRGEMI